MLTIDVQGRTKGAKTGEVSNSYQVESCGRALAGTVVDPEGRPVADAIVVASRGDFRSTPALSDERGRFRLAGLPAAPVDLVAHGSGTGLRGRLDGATPGSWPRLVLAGPAALSGVLGGLASRGRCRVSAEGPERRSITVQPEAHGYRFDRLAAGEYQVTATCDGGIGGRKVSIAPSASETAELAIEPWASVSGRLLDATGRPIVGALIAVDDRSLAWPDVRASISDADGRFALERADPRARRLLAAKVDSRDPETLGGVAIELRPGAAHDLGDVRLRR
jgi:hypothetical protein